jgi:CheY-like chemotaxis protein/SAM-dependent methyltransferase
VGQKILVVEDNELNLRLFCDILRAHGYEAAPVRDGREAVDQARAFVPDLVIMDIQMPYISGLEIIEQLKADAALAPIPVMAVTAYAARGDEDRIRDAGAEGYVSKPISVIRFVEAVRALLAVAEERQAQADDGALTTPEDVGSGATDDAAGEGDAIHGYVAEAAELVPHFEALSAEEVLAPVLDLLPQAPSRILEIGAGTGRDAAWLAARGHEVLAAEPVEAFRVAGLERHPRLEWIDDRLPALDRLRSTGERFDLVLLVAVWQHLAPAEQSLAMASLAKLVAPGGRLIISVRHGPGSPARPCYPADPDRMVADAAEDGLVLDVRREAESVQAANRAAGVTWTWLCFSRRSVA